MHDIVVWLLSGLGEPIYVLRSNFAVTLHNEILRTVAGIRLLPDVSCGLTKGMPEAGWQPSVAACHLLDTALPERADLHSTALPRAWKHTAQLVVPLGWLQ